jgi:hypothetical protein
MGQSEQEWIAQLDAYKWAAQKWALSEGAAEAAVRAAITSNNVHLLRHVDSEWADLMDGKIKIGLAKDFRTVADVLFTGHQQELRFADLQWQLRQQLGEPPAERPQRGRSPKPYWRGPKGGDNFIDDELKKMKGTPVKGDGKQAALESAVADFLGERGNYPGEATIRQHVVDGINRKIKATKGQ